MGSSSAADASTPDAGMLMDGPADATSGVEDGEVPMNHRPAGSVCPMQRGPGFPCSCASEDASSCTCGACTSDSDCTAGTNGRCETGGPIAYWTCSYDECFQDSDCEAGVPCECRPSNVSSAANECLRGSNCAVDLDCGPGGYCSPSALELCGCLSTALCGDSGGCYAGGQEVPCACGDACGHGYFCHTPRDTCVNDSDCPPGRSCYYNRLEQRWDCEFCLPPP